MGPEKGRKEGRKSEEVYVRERGKECIVTHPTSASDAQDNGGFYSVGVPYSAMAFYRFSSAVKSEALGITLIYRPKTPARGSDRVCQTAEIKPVHSGSFARPGRRQDPGLRRVRSNMRFLERVAIGVLRR